MEPNADSHRPGNWGAKELHVRGHFAGLYSANPAICLRIAMPFHVESARRVSLSMMTSFVMPARYRAVPLVLLLAPGSLPGTRVLPNRFGDATRLRPRSSPVSGALEILQRRNYRK